MTLQDVCQLNRLLITFDILKHERLFDGIKQTLHLVASLRQLGGRADKAFLARQFPQWRTADTVDEIFQSWVAEAAHDLFNVSILLLFRDAVLLYDEHGCLAQDVAHDVVDLLVYHRFVDVLLTALLAVVGGGSVTRIDGEELTLDKGFEVIHKVNSLDFRVADAMEGRFLDAPFVELFDLDVEACVGVLVRDDAVDGAIGEASFGVDVGLGFFTELVKNEPLQRVGGIDGIFACDDGDWVIQLAVLNGLGDNGCDELENIRADGASDDVGSGNLFDYLALLVLGIDGAVVVDGEDALTVLTNLDDLVGRLFLEGINDVVQNIDEDDFISGVVEELGDEATV